MWNSNKGIGLGILMWLLHVPRLSSANPRQVGSADGAYNINTDLQSLLQDTTISQNKELTEALAWINKLPTETSCTQLAAMKLMTECKLLDDPSGFAAAHPEVHLDDIKLEYAVKLAVCEIAGAQPEQPHYALQNCEVFLPSTQACNKRSWWGHTQQPTSNDAPCYPPASEKNLSLCFKTLRSSPQYWTSYSNAKFRAANMCQLSRHAIEREKTIQLHKNLTLVTFRLHSSLHGVETQMRAIQTELRQSSEGFKKSSESIKHSTDQFNQFVKESHREAARERHLAKEEIRSMQLAVGSVRDSIIADITAHNKRFNSQMDTAMTKAIAAVRTGQVDTLAALGGELQRFYDTLQNESSALAASMNKQLQEYHEKAALAIQTQHDTMVESYNIMSTNLAEANGKVVGLAGKVDDIDEKTRHSLARLDHLDHRLDGIGTKFKSVEQAFAFLDLVLGVGKVCIAIALVVAALFFLIGINNHFYKITILLFISISLSSWYYGVSFQTPGRMISTSPESFTIPIKNTWTQYLSIPHPFLLGGAGIGCLFVAAYLHRINAAWEAPVVCLEHLLFKLARCSGILSQRRDKNNIITLPSAEIPGA